MVEMHELSKLVLAKQQLVHASPRSLASTMSTLALEVDFLIPCSPSIGGNHKRELTWGDSVVSGLVPKVSHIPPIV